MSSRELKESDHGDVKSRSQGNSISPASIGELADTKQEYLNLRFRNATGQLDNSAAIGTTRKQIARINTLIRQREIAAAEAQETK